MRDIEADYRRAYETEYETLKAQGHDKAAARIAAILGKPAAESKPKAKSTRPSTRGKEAATAMPETAVEK